MLYATCHMVGAVVIGAFYFFQEDYYGPTFIVGSASGMSPGKHGFHIVSYGDVEENCNRVGSHFNPFYQQHGAPNDTDKHAGDLGNIDANQAGNGSIALCASSVSLYGYNSVIGRGLQITEREDDLGRGYTNTSTYDGNSGSPIACCVIGWGNTNFSDKSNFNCPSYNADYTPSQVSYPSSGNILFPPKLPVNAVRYPLRLVPQKQPTPPSQPPQGNTYSNRVNIQQQPVPPLPPPYAQNRRRYRL